jgi:hypothetical protein
VVSGSCFLDRRAHLLHRLFQFSLVVCKQSVDFTVRFIADRVDL